MQIVPARRREIILKERVAFRPSVQWNDEPIPQGNMAA